MTWLLVDDPHLAEQAPRLRAQRGQEDRLKPPVEALSPCDLRGERSGDRTGDAAVPEPTRLLANRCSVTQTCPQSCVHKTRVAVGLILRCFLNSVLVSDHWQLGENTP